MAAHLELPPVVRDLTLNPPLSDEEFEELCAVNGDIQLERTKDGKIVVNPPTGGFTGDGNREIIYQLSAWWRQHRLGRAFDSSTGFFLPDGSMFSPDAAYVRPERLRGLTREAGARILRLCPNFVMELLSSSDRLKAAERKMENWIANGAELAWLIDPYQRQVHIYEPGQETRIEAGSGVTGSGPVEGFILDAAEVWSRYEPDEE
jgi:Uma2 family endonuclease